MGHSPPLQRCSQTAAALPAHLTVILSVDTAIVNKNRPVSQNEKRGLSCPSHKLGTPLEIPPGTSCRARALPLPPLAPPLWGSSRRSRVRGAQGCAKSLPPGRGKVARPKAVTDEGAAIRRTASPPRPLIRPSVRTGAPSPRRVEGLSCGGQRGFRRLQARPQTGGLFSVPSGKKPAALAAS
jgi:hypothetical protein